MKVGKNLNWEGPGVTFSRDYSGCPPRPSLIKTGSWETDFRNPVYVEAMNSYVSPQDEAASFVHSMTDGTAGQLPSDAQVLRDEFVSDRFDQARRQQAAWSNLGNPGLSPAALLIFGQGLHSLQDETSPQHRGFQKWHGVHRRTLVKGARHLAGEAHMSRKVQEETVSVTRGAFLAVFGPALYQQAVKEKKKDYETQITIRYGSIE